MVVKYGGQPVCPLNYVYSVCVKLTEPRHAVYNEFIDLHPNGDGVCDYFFL